MADITLDHVTKRYPDGYEAVKDMNLQIQDGEFVILVGPSGCGKSTALRMVAGLEDISEGELKIGGDVVPRLFCSFLISTRVETRSLASRFESGSSNRNALGRRTIARPIATRWRWPPESWRGLRSSSISISRIRAASRTRVSISSFGVFRLRKP